MQNTKILFMNNNFIDGIFIQRENRFIAEVSINEINHKVHVANTGRCKELLVTGVKVLLKISDNPTRKTRYSLIYVENKGVWVNLVSVSANEAVFNSLINGEIQEIDNPQSVKREYSLKGSRIDIYCKSNDVEVFIEVKSVTLIKDGFLQFPDAPTQRGLKHLDELIKLKDCGKRAIVLFVAQHPLGKYFKANEDNDPAFAAKLKDCNEKGVEILVYMSSSVLGELKLTKKIPFIV